MCAAELCDRSTAARLTYTQVAGIIEGDAPEFIARRRQPLVVVIGQPGVDQPDSTAPVWTLSKTSSAGTMAPGS